MSAENQFRILVVDDDPKIVFMLTNLLEDNGYQVVTAANGEVALDCAAIDHPDLVLLDVGLPDMDGTEVCAKLRRNPLTRSIRVIFLTAFSSDERLEQAIDMGGDDFLIKPVNGAELLLRIRALLQTRNIPDEIERLSEYIETMNTLRGQVGTPPPKTPPDRVEDR